MSQDGEKSINSNHVNELCQLDKEFDSILNVIRRSNMDPYKIFLKRIIGELPIRDVEFDSVEKFKKRLAEICNKEINRDSLNFEFDLLSKCGKEIINATHGSINFDKAALLLESSAKVYSSKVDHLHSLVSQAAKNVRKRKGRLMSILDPHDTAAVDEYLKGEVDVRKGQHGGNPVPRNAHEDDSAYCHGDSSGYESPVLNAKIEENLHPLLVNDSSLANISESEKQTEMAARVSLWEQQIKQDLEEHEARPAFDVKDYGKRVLHKLSESVDLENNVSFADVVQGKEKHDVARSFSAVLHLANNVNIDLQRSETDNEELMSSNPFSVRLRGHIKRRQQVQFQSSKRRAVSQTNEGESKDKRGNSGKENREP